MKQQFFDLAFEQNEDGIIRLTQNDYGEPVYIDLHPQQLAYIAHAFNKQPDQAALPRALIRRLDRLRGGIEALYDYLDAVPCFPPGRGETEDVTMARELLDGIDDLFEEFGLVEENRLGYASVATGNPNESHQAEQAAKQQSAQLGLDV